MDLFLHGFFTDRPDARAMIAWLTEPMIDLIILFTQDAFTIPLLSDGVDLDDIQVCIKDTNAILDTTENIMQETLALFQRHFRPLLLSDVHGYYHACGSAFVLYVGGKSIDPSLPAILSDDLDLDPRLRQFIFQYSKPMRSYNIPEVSVHQITKPLADQLIHGISRPPCEDVLEKPTGLYDMSEPGVLCGTAFQLVLYPLGPL